MATGPVRKPAIAARDVEAPFETANLAPKRTGLDFVVWISNRGGAEHDARIKVSRTPHEPPQAVFAVRDGDFVAGDKTWMTGAQLHRLDHWLDRNRSVLLTFWDSEEWDHQDAIERLQRL